MTNTEIAAAFFDALAKEDEVALRALCTPDFKPQQNGGPALSIEALLGFAAAIHGVVQDFAYGDPVRSGTASGFVQEHHVLGRLPNGKAVDLPVCVVGDITDGKIAAAREYFDSAAAAEVLAAMH